MGSRRQWALVAGVLAGAAGALIPTVAASETPPTITAVNVPAGLYESHSWSPSQVTVAPGGGVTLSNQTEVPHGVHWVGGPATPTCEGAVPVGTDATAAGTNWHGTCTFPTAGVYTFYCTVHGPEMTGHVTVQGSSETTPTTTTTSTTPPPASGGEQGAGSPAAGSPPPAAGASPLAGAALRLSSVLRAGAVRGSLRVAAAGAGGRLEVDLLASRASLARAGFARLTRVGRLVRRAVAAGPLSFKVALDPRARNALARHHRLALTVRVLLTPPHRATATLSRGLLLRR